MNHFIAIVMLSSNNSFIVCHTLKNISQPRAYCDHFYRLKTVTTKICFFQLHFFRNNNNYYTASVMSV